MTLSGAKKLTVEPFACKKPSDKNRNIPSLWIHAEAGPRMGFGHIKRCMNIARELRGFARAFFVLRPGDKWSGGLVEAEGYEYQNTGFSDIRLCRPVNPSAVLIDTRVPDGLDAFIRTAREKSIPVLSLHDMGLNPLCSDIAVDGSIVEASAGGLPARRVLCGAAYMVLDPAFREQRPKSLIIGKEIRSVLVSLGGGNTQKYFLRVLDGLKLWSAAVKREIEVVGMRGFVDWGQDLLNEETLRPLRFRWESGSAAGLLRGSDLAVTAGGISAYEALCSGTPLFALSWDLFQQTAVDSMTEAGCCVNLGAGDDLTPDFFVSMLEKFDKAVSEREKMARRGMEIVDGRGAKRVAAVIRREILRSARTKQAKQLNSEKT